MSEASSPHKRPDDSWCPTCDEYQNDAYWDLVEQLEAAQNAMKEALAALMVGQPDRPRPLHDAERILRAALATRLEIEIGHEPSLMDWPEDTPRML